MRELDVSGKCVFTGSLWHPDRLVESAWLEHAPFAFWLVRQLKPKTFVELGAHNGFSFSAFCQAVQQLDLGTTCTAVDTWQGDEHAGFYGEDIYSELSSYIERYAGFARLLRMTFEDARNEVADKSVDLLHVDGRHFYDDVKYDFESWVPKLTDNAIVLFHDTTVFERDFGVHQFWKELSDRYPSFEFLHGHGLGVACIGDTPPEGLRPLFEAARSADETESIRLTYARLGKTVSDLFARQARIRDLEGQCVSSLQRIEQLQAEHTLALDEEKNHRAEEVEALRAALEASHLEHRADVQAFEQSLSWRVTAVLRSGPVTAIRRAFGSNRTS